MQKYQMIHSLPSPVGVPLQAPLAGEGLGVVRSSKMEKMKRCTKCGEILPVTMFSSNNSSKDGLQHWCKACCKVYYVANRDAINERDRARYAANRDAINERDRARYAAHPERVAAHHAVEHAIARGDLVRPTVCDINNSTCLGKIEAHHSSYKESDWFNVTWLCTSHHRRLHSEAKETQ